MDEKSNEDEINKRHYHICGNQNFAGPALKKIGFSIFRRKQRKNFRFRSFRFLGE
jgi:hypothetical protein